MLDIKRIRKEKDRIEELVKRKEPDLDLTEVVRLDEQMRALKTEDEHLKAQRNALSKEVGERKQKGEAAEELMEEVRQIGQRMGEIGPQLARLEEKFVDALACFPNIPMDDVKVSQDKEENVCLKSVGEKPSFDFPPKNHLELNESLDLFDFQKTAVTTGAGWPAYKGLGARLEWALLNYMIDIQLAHGYEFWLPPLLVRPPIMFGSGQMPKFKGQFYQIDDEESPLYLIPTAEVILNGLHYNEIVPEEKLPLRYVSYTPCFRREAGAAGAHERGLIRVHQFNKIEMFCFTKPEESQKTFDQMVHVAEEILNGLQLPYRLSLLVTGDMSFTAARTIDMEVWLPGQDSYYEVSSISNCTDYQARRSQIRFKGKEGKTEYVHTLNGSGLATPRLMVALLENNQREDGSVALPPVLQERLGMEALVPGE